MDAILPEVERKFPELREKTDAGNQDGSWVGTAGILGRRACLL